IYNCGAVNVTGGTVEATGSNGRAIHNADGGTITISGNAAVSATTGQAIYNASTGEIKVTGGTVTATSGNAIRNQSTGTVKVEGGAVSSPNQAIWNNAAGTVTVSDGKVTASGSSGKAIYNYDAGGTVNVSGGTVEATDPNAIAIYNVNTGTVNVSGGTVSAAAGNAIYNVSTGKITISNNATVTSANTNDGTIYLFAVPSSGESKVVLDIQGGTVENTSADGYAVYFNTNGTGVTYDTLSAYYTKTGGTVGKVYPEAPTNVVEITSGSNTTLYTTLAGAITAATTGDTLKVIADIDLGTGVGVINGKTLTLDLNGHTVTNSGTNGSSAVIKLDNGASLTVTDGSSGQNGTLEAVNYAIWNISTGAVTISGGTLKATGENGKAIYNSPFADNTANGTITVNGGTVTATGTSGYAISGSAGAVNVSSGTVSATGASGSAIDSSGAITVSGGTVTATGASGIAIDSVGAVTVSGSAKVSAATGNAIFNYGAGKITISDSAEVTSANTSATSGTIFLQYVPNGIDNLLTLDIQGGTVQNTADPAGYSVYFADASGVTAANLGTYYSHTGGTVGRLYPAAVELLDSGDTFKGSYATLAAAIGAAQTNDKLVINETIDLGSGAGVEI
ncbi:MAG: beta strand repeat-containing protein, partial [Gemmiger formicilis]|uniref:beta strand repeat-containing protein n=3 Tax=Eubacteriales TaxID=186802 RepID=UPI0039911BEC